jgi:glycosyltransferase involved in cell wall biosynthesis
MAKFNYWFDHFLIRLLGYRENSPFSLLRRGKTWPNYSDLQSADIIHLHWVGNSFLNLEDFEGLKAKFVWTLRDWWPLTGGWHIPQDLKNFTEKPQKFSLIPSYFFTNLVTKEQSKKTSFLRSTTKVKTLAQSHFMQRDAEQALDLLPGSVEVIPSSINDQVYKYCKKSDARKKLGLLPDELVVAVGATNVNDAHKGLHILKKIPQNSKLKKCIFLIFGDGDLILPEGIVRHDYGFISSESMMSDIYSASDIVLCPSLYESFGKVALESIACGTPVIAFAETGQAEIIERTGGGRLALPNNTDSFFYEAEIQLREINEDFRLAIAQRAYQEYSSDRVSSDHIDLYLNFLAS